MTKYLVFLVLFSVAFAIPTTMNNALRNQVVIDFKNAIVPIISRELQEMKLPDIQGKQSGIKYHIFDILVRVNPISPAQVGIDFVPSSTIRLSGSTLGMSGKARARARWHFIRKTVDVKITVSKMSFSTSVSLVSVNNKPNIQVVAFDLSLSHKDISIKISGGLIGKVINLLVGLLKGHIVKNVVNGIKKEMPKAITAMVNKVLNSLATDIRITNNINMKYQFSKSPIVKNGFLLTGIVAYLHASNDPAPPPGPVTPMPEIDNANNRGVQFFLSDYVVRSAINAAYKLKLMYVNVNKKIENRMVKMVCSAAQLPDFKFANAIRVSADGICTVSLDNDPNPKFELKATLDLSLKESIKNAVIFFSVDKFTFSKLEFKMIQEIDIEWFKKAINEVFDAILAIINGELGQRGIPLPVIKEIDYTDIIQYVGNGFTMIGTTPKFNLRMEDFDEIVIEFPSEPVEVTDEVRREYLME